MKNYESAADILKEEFLTESERKKLETILEILKDMGINENIQLAGSLYFCASSGKFSIDDIKSTYSGSIVENVSILDKLAKVNYTQQDIEAGNLRKLFFAITKDIRIIMLKIGFAVADLRCVDMYTKEEAEELAKLVLNLYAPLAARLALGKYKTELENTSFYILNPEKYNEIQADVDARFHKRQPLVDKLVELTKACLDELGIKGRVYGRKKAIYSIYKKLGDHTIDQIFDLVAIRAIVSTVPECYALLGRLSSNVEPMSKRFKDYITNPKPNGYQSLHTTVTYEGYPVEIQIRTEDMHKYAEYGIAAHWIYKEKRTKQDSLDEQLARIRQMIDDENFELDELADSMNQDIYNQEIFVQTPKGKVIYLPSGATPIDFAYAIHSEIGNKCTGAKVNGKMVPVSSMLNNGDVVEIITNPNSKGPSRDWLKMCKTSGAKSKINAFFKKEVKEETVSLGKSMLENAIKDKGYSVNKLLTKSAIEEVMGYYNFANINELYANLGVGSLSAKNITNRLVVIFQKQQKKENATAIKGVLNLSEPTDKMVSVKDLDNTIIKFAKCCKPMYGDEIVGFISSGRGVIIHRTHCPNVGYFSKSRLIEASWKQLK